MLSWTIAPREVGLRLDAALARHLGLSVHEARRLLDEDRVRVDGRRTKKGQRLAAHARIELRAELDEDGALLDRSIDVRAQPELPLALLYEDEHLLVINKPAGCATHPLRRGELGTVANALVARYPECMAASLEAREGGLAHRLDRDTTGVLVAARYRAAFLALRRAFSEHRVEKTYWALVHGLPPATAVIDVPLASRGGSARVAAQAEHGLEARTELRLLVAGGGYALVEASARTGRMHQIRAHLAHLGHPLVGDTRYGAPATEGLPPDHALLHARSLELPHPSDGHSLRCVAPLPPQRLGLCERLLARALPTDL